jgi:membrane associated rhomboid family serine protease
MNSTTRSALPAESTARALARGAKRQALTLSVAIGTMWGAFVANTMLGGALTRFGIVPRTESGVIGILVAPLLHANLNHLLANTVPFAVLGWLVMLRDRRHFLTVTALSALGAGLVAWVLGAPGSVHIGASGVIFGYLGFLLMSGWYARSVASVALAVLVASMWGGMVFGILPGTPGVSWQGHLGGFVGGVLAARLFRARVVIR